MSEVKVNKISPRTNCGTVQLGDSGDTITIPAGATITTMERRQDLVEQELLVSRQVQLKQLTLQQLMEKVIFAIQQVVLLQ